MTGQSTDGIERSANITVDGFEDCKQAGEQVEDALYTLFEERDVVEFEITIRSVEQETDRSNTSTEGSR